MAEQAALEWRVCAILPACHPIARMQLPNSRDSICIGRQLERAQAEQAALERRLSDANDAEGRYLHEIRDLEASVADRCGCESDCCSCALPTPQVLTVTATGPPRARGSGSASMNG